LETPQKITIQLVPWFSGARELIATAEPGGAEILDWIEQEITAGRMTLFQCRDEWTEIGIFTARWYRRYDGLKILQIVHGIATHKEEGFSFMIAIREEVKKIARDCGCVAVELHTRRRGMDRRLENNGYKFQETIFSIEV
jgi:hypothetical protein